MGSRNNISDILEEYSNQIEEYNRRLLDETNRKVNEYLERYAYPEFGEQQEIIIRRIFNDAVTNFYNAYTPIRYERQGDTFSKSGGLYEVLSIKKDESGMVIFDDPGYDDLYDESRLHRDRKGGDLYRKVFVEGWHGGAESIDSNAAETWGEHPETGVPYYRRPGWIKYPGSTKRTWHKYGKWGKRAVRTESVYQLMQENLKDAEASEIFDEFKRISQKYNDEAIKTVYEEIVPMVQNEIFG